MFLAVRMSRSVFCVPDKIDENEVLAIRELADKVLACAHGVFQFKVLLPRIAPPALSRAQADTLRTVRLREPDKEILIAGNRCADDLALVSHK